MTDSREHILNISLKLFLQKSFKEVTMKEIVEKTGLSKGAFYHYFSSKEQVFEEVVDFFLSGIMIQDFDKFSHKSLKEFYIDYLDDMSDKIVSAGKLLSFANEPSTPNQYFLLFDAIKLIPSFKETLTNHNAYELKSWKKIVSVAKKSGEITTKLTDDQVAKLFIFLGDGFGMHLMLGDISIKPTEIILLYEGIYNGLKT